MPATLPFALQIASYVAALLVVAVAALLVVAVAALLVVAVAAYAWGYATGDIHGRNVQSSALPSPPTPAPHAPRPVQQAHIHVLSPIGTWATDEMTSGDTMLLGVRQGGHISIVPYPLSRLYVDVLERHYHD